MRVLLAHRDETTLETMQSQLWKHGFQTKRATDGMACISMLRELKPEVLVLEKGLLWGGDEGVLTVMDEDPELAEIPVVMIEADGSPIFTDSPNCPLIVSRLKQPFKIQDLLAHIQAAGRFQDIVVSPLV